MVSHLIELIGTIKLARKVRDVDFALGKLAKQLSTRSVRLARMILIQAIRNAMVDDLVVRNVADLAAVPTGKPGRPSRSLTLDQAHVGGPKYATDVRQELNREASRTLTDRRDRLMNSGNGGD